MKLDVNAVAEIIREVAEMRILPRFRKLDAQEIAYKVGDDPVTIADKEAERDLSARLSDLLKGSKTVGEEAFAANPGILSRFSDESPVWIIDPIDGTRNFVKGKQEFGVIVALAEQNHTIAGWIYHPTSGELITAEMGSGAWYRNQKLTVAKPNGLRSMRGFLGDQLLRAQRDATSIASCSPDFEAMTASAFEYPRLVIADGPFAHHYPQCHFRASFFHSTPWDDAAGVLIHAESGGYSAFWDGTPYCPSVMNRGLALTPDKESWFALRRWIENFSELPELDRTSRLAVQ